MRRSLLATGLVAAVLACSKSEPAAPVAAKLDLWMGQHNITLGGIGQSVRVHPALTTLDGDTLEMPPGFTLVSRDTATVGVDSGTRVFARKPTAQTRVVGTVVYQGRLFGDSMSVVVSCPAVLYHNVTPSSISITVGETSVAPVVTYSGGCGETLIDTFTWTVGDATIVSVNAATGAVTGLKAGQTSLSWHGAKYGGGSIGVTVH